MNKYKKFDRARANFSALTPLTLLQRSAPVYPDKQAVIDADLVLSYGEPLCASQSMDQLILS